MVESMVERVARAICTAAQIDPNRKGNETEWRWQEFETEARAAIEAMRKPTDAMVDALTSYDSNPESLYDRAIDAALNEQVSG